MLPSYAGYRFPAEVIGYAVWLYFRFPLSLRTVEEILAASGIIVSYETVRQWGLTFGREIATAICRRAPRRGDKWHLDEIVITITGRKGTVLLLRAGLQALQLLCLRLGRQLDLPGQRSLRGRPHVAP